MFPIGKVSYEGEKVKSYEELNEILEGEREGL